MSKKIFSAQDWENVPFENRVPELPKLLPAPNLVSENKEEEIERIICEIEQRAVDIAPEYKDWVELGFALIDGFGENGREYYHRISRFHPDYQREETDKQYTRCLQAKGQGVTIRSFFHLAGQAGIPLSPAEEQYLSILPNIQNGKTGKWIKSADELPAFSECVFEQLPPFLCEVVGNSISEDDRDTILIGAIVCLSVCFHNVCGVYDERIVYPNLYLFVVADAGMGKGALTLCRELVAPINRNLHELSQRMERIGIRNTQYIIARHYDTQHPHCHLVFNRIDNDGNLISDSNERIRSTKVCRALTEEYGLYLAPKNSKARNKNRLRPHQLRKINLRSATLDALTKSHSWKDFLSALKVRNIDIRFNRNQASDKVHGVSFSQDGISLVGSTLDRDLSF